MIDRLLVFESDSLDPYRNLAIERHLLESVSDGCCILYLWQNDRTVVIGRNQNAWTECRTELLKREGGRLARRLSGGGAVYHDTGNLNFTFLVKTADYDLDRQLDVISSACVRLGVKAERSGRNDLTASGKKFSGSAFYRQNDRSYHHGTLLVDTDTDRMERYLSPSAAKLESKGVKSVRSRVVNLREINPSVTVEALKDALKTSFSEVYGRGAEPFGPVDESAVGALTERFSGETWLFGRSVPLTFRCEKRFPWGGLELQIKADRGFVDDIAVYTDDNDHETAEKICLALRGSRFSTEELSRRIEMNRVPHAADIITMLSEQEI
ncbi:MAG: lipoate--protein ligase [Clostridia bacterium]|nr:lipoate--protein ligase [Clostridia bacterium]